MAKLFSLASLLGSEAIAVGEYKSLREESPDFIGEDTSERLGVARLRKVQQRVVRCLGRKGETPP